MLGVESESAADFADADSVVGFSADDLAAIGAESIEDIALFTPNLEIITAGATSPTFFIRGVGLNDFNPNSTGAVSIYQDDVAINAPPLQLGILFDTEQVNVERGPQGTGQARNSSAGAIRLYSRKPTGEFGGYLRSDFGNYDFQDYEGAVEAPIVDDMLSGRFAFRLSQRDGVVRNRCAGAPPFDERVRHPGGNAIQTIPPWSICGEPVVGPLVPNPKDPLEGLSDIPVGLEKDVGNTDNWAARGTLRFDPTPDMVWYVNGHGSRRDEISRLGQSIGTGNFFCTDGKICEAPFAGSVPPELADSTARSGGWLGGPQNGDSIPNDYIPREIRERIAELIPCLAVTPATCNSVGGSPRPLDFRFAYNQAKLELSRELAENLDSEPWEGDFNHTGPTRNSTYGSFVKGEISLPFDFQLTSTSGYDTYDRVVDIDLDQSPEVLFEIRTEDDAWQFYQDLNLSRELFSDTFPVLFDVGGYMLREELSAFVDNNLGQQQAFGVGSRDYTQKLWSAGGYGSFSFDFWTDFTLDGGVRYNWDHKSLDMLVFEGFGVGDDNEPSDFSVTDTWDAPTGTLRLTYRFRDDTHVYWKYTRGWKPGTFNATVSQFSGPTVANPEKIDSFETGIRGAWLDGRLALDTQFFYYAYRDYQIFTAQQFFGGVPEFVILNANDAEVYGAEVDASARPWEGSFFAVRFSWLESQFLDYVRTDQFLAAQGGGNLVEFREAQASGNPLLNSPKYKISLTAEQTVPLGSIGFGTVRYDAAWSDQTYYDSTKGVGIGDRLGRPFLPKDTISQVPFWVHNLRVGWRSPDERIEVAGWVRNLTNEAYKTFAFDGSAFRKTTIYYVGDPRTYGGSISVNF